MTLAESVLVQSQESLGVALPVLSGLRRGWERP